MPSLPYPEPSSPRPAALDYASRGWLVFPATGKHPHLEAWPEVASTDARRIVAWWNQWPAANVAILTGEKSGVWVLDVDPRKGGDDALAALARQHGPLPETVEALTGSGGRHLYFRHPGPAHRIPNSAGRLGEGLDVRGDGGYVIAPPSQHPDGGRYRWEATHGPDLVPLAVAPAGWLRLVLDGPRRAAPAVAEIIPTGQRNATLASLAGTMRKRGLSAAELTAALLVVNQRCAPPLPEAEVMAIAESVAKYPPEDLSPRVEPAAEARDNGGGHRPSAPDRLELMTIDELFETPDEEAPWLVDRLLLTGGTSILGAKPKTGKSTTVRALCVAIATGSPFLGRTVTSGPVVYINFEEKRSQVKALFRRRIKAAGLPIRCYIGRSIPNAVRLLRRAISDLPEPPVLVTIDTLGKLLRVKDISEYALMTEALDPLLNLAREVGAHTLVAHHTGKLDRDDPLDELLGSTAIAGWADAVLVLKRDRERRRILLGEGREGFELDETIVALDKETQEITTAGSRQAVDDAAIDARVVAYVEQLGRAATREEVLGEVEGRREALLASLGRLVAAGRVQKNGKGKKGDPFVFLVCRAG
jgi:Bifunctional DNA primase/polymerase, N-terminal/AAA domain/Primase C terminal 1 (PriCT-1)